MDRAELLTFEEIAHFVRVAAPLGIDKVRLTGGEPLMRRDLPRLVRMLVGHSRRPRRWPDHQRPAPRRAGPGALRRRPAPHQRQPRHARPRPLPRGRPPRRPGARAGRHRRREEGGLSSHQDQRRQHSRPDRRGRRAAGPLCAGTRPGDAVHRVHADRRRGVGARQGLLRARDPGADRARGLSAGPGCRTTTRAPRRWTSPTPTAAARWASSRRCRGRSA